MECLFLLSFLIKVYIEQGCKKVGKSRDGEDRSEEKEVTLESNEKQGFLEFQPLHLNSPQRKMYF